jgi:NitT/TauT family transport system substrate-binding protein
MKGRAMDAENLGFGQFNQRRRQLLLATAAAMAPFGGHSFAQTAAKPLQVGGLPVTCNLSLPIACTMKSAAGGQGFEFSKFSGWPEIKESQMSGRLQAAYMLAPLVMDMVNKKIPVKIVALGHRSGAVIMVRTDSPYKDFKSLKGKRVAIPSRFAVDYLFLRRVLQKEGLTEKDVQVVEMAPPDMPAALYAKAVDAYATGEPFGAVAQRAGYARPLSMTRDEWPLYLCCVLTVREELIKSNRPLVQQLVNHVLAAGQWLDQAPANRTRAVEIAAKPQFFNQDVNVLKFVMENPPDRVTYGDLKLVKTEFDELMQLSIEAGTMKAHIPFENYVDGSFVKNASAVGVTFAA